MLGWKISDETVRHACEREAERMAAWMQTAPQVRAQFEEAEGEVEFQTDATKVNTVEEGWKDLKIGIFAKRPLGEPAEAAAWDSRDLPAPSVRVAFAAVEKIEDFTTTCSGWMPQLGVTKTTSTAVLGDGAEWIWNLAATLFDQRLELLDVYHALEHLWATARVLFGERSATKKAWVDGGRDALLKDGWHGFCEFLSKSMTPDDAPARRKALGELIGYFAKHTQRLNYAHRLHTGRAIGSGMVEGAASHMIGRRLKQTGARWRRTHLDAMSAMCCLTYSGGWQTYWTLAA